MASGDRVWHRCHPIFACFVSNYPEQVLVTCTYSGYCPKCLVPLDELGEPNTFPSRNYHKALVLYSLAEGDAHPFHAACHEAQLKPVFHPFWENFPLADIYLSVTLDILHQLLQGVMKHLISWLTSSDTFGPTVIDARCRSIPPNHHIKLFSKGITTLSCILGKEYKAICRILIGLIVDLPLPHGQVPTQVLRAVWVLLDFLYLAQFRSHTTDSIHCLKDSLTHFHENKVVFTDLSIWGHFNIPKIHSLMHYGPSIALFGTTNNYNTKQTKCLHIDFTKDAYCASNHKDKLPQMTTWLSQCKKVQQHVALVRSRQEPNQQHGPSVKTIGPPQPGTRSLKMTQHPSIKAVSFDDIDKLYGAIQFQDALGDFIACINYPSRSGNELYAHAVNTLIPFCSVPVFHKVKFTSNNVEPAEIIDAIHVWPEQKDTYGQIIPPRFDTVLVLTECQDGTHRKDCEFQPYCHPYLTQCGASFQIAQARVVFEIPSKQISQVFLHSVTTPPTHLAYIEWFSQPSAMQNSSHGLYKVSYLMKDGSQQASIIPLSSVISSIHLLPWFGQNHPQDMNSFIVLEKCQSFYVNPFSDMYNYMILS